MEKFSVSKQFISDNLKWNNGAGHFKKLLIFIGLFSIFLVVNETPSYSYTLTIPNLPLVVLIMRLLL